MRAYIAELKKRAAFRENPYFRALADGSFSKEDFLETQIQFCFAVLFFSRPMMGLAARLPDAGERWTLLKNISDEHGDGDLALSHERTFLLFLERLGVEKAYAETRALWPEVRAFNTVLSGLALFDDPLTAIAAFGIIEDLFAEISAFIGQTLVARGWIPSERVVHYATHEALDVEHADDFYKLIEGAYAKRPAAAYQVEQGLELGAHVFLRMYRELYEARGRRRAREISGPHRAAAGTAGWGA